MGRPRLRRKSARRTRAKRRKGDPAFPPFFRSAARRFTSEDGSSQKWRKNALLAPSLDSTWKRSRHIRGIGLDPTRRTRRRATPQVRST
ncbi:hypothetical protein C5689_05305 [Methylosinus sporium]|uniref:Uncharacterized protein n=1 Tax=Methylosinus sporium TaxID=428 RepID=A0A2U1STB5_METSR|nr:hypothetical protein C5689_05305 [Methylosinus sporium]